MKTLRKRIEEYEIKCMSLEQELEVVKRVVREIGTYSVERTMFAAILEKLTEFMDSKELCSLLTKSLENKK